jgi:DNA-binding transcriptional LysR family regulator
MLLELITPLVENFDSLKAVFLDRRRDVVRRLTVATTSAVLANELLEPVRLCRQRHPDVRFSFIERPSREALPLLESGHADLAFVGVLEAAPRPATLEFDEWLRYPFVLICPPEHPLATMRGVNLRNLVEHPLLLPAEATNARARIEEVLRSAGFFEKTNVVLESSTSLVLARYAEMGLGVALTSLSPILVEELRTGSHGHGPLVVRDLTGLFGSEPVVIAHRKGRHLLNHINEFRQLTLAATAKLVTV